MGRVLSFDGERATGVISNSDEAALEVFTMDLPEGMFASLRSGAALQHLGNRFGPDLRLNPNYTGPRLDIFHVTARSPISHDPELRTKFFYFDSATGYLQRTLYGDSETRFSDWGIIDGSAYPGRVDHYENGQLVFSFTAAKILASHAADPAQFR
jgi:hypothetical protein